MGTDHTAEIVHRELDTDRENPAIQIVEVVAALEEEPEEELATVWGCIDDVLSPVFSTPPSPEAQLEITFSYEGYRVTVNQDGHAKFVEIE